MNHSIYSADRTTHLKIVVVALVAEYRFGGLRHLGPQLNSGRLDIPRPRASSRPARP